MKKFFLAGLVAAFTSIASSVSAKEEPVAELEIDNSIVIDRIGNSDIEVSSPHSLFSFSEAEITLRFVNPNHTRLLVNQNRIPFIINGEQITLEFVDGVAKFEHSFKDNNQISIFAEEFSYRGQVTVYPFWVVLVPALLVIGWLVSRVRKRKEVQIENPA